VTATACGKAIIVGEHAVVYGARAVAMPVFSMRIGVKLSPRLPQSSGREPTIRVRLGGRSVSAHVRSVVDEAINALGVKPFPMEVDGTSTLAVGAGLGSSAALCVVLLRAIAASTGLSIPRDVLAAMGNRLERRFHGNPSGLDAAVVAWEEVLAFRRGAAPEPLSAMPFGGRRSDARDRPWRFALLDTQARASTMAMIQVAAPWFTGQQGAARVERFDEIAGLALESLRSGDRGGLATAMNESGALLAEAGIVNDAMRAMIAAAREARVLAAKPTGAGGGGCVLVLLDDTGDARPEAQLDRLRAAIGPARVHAVELP
jgi:mevalonate kinase